LSLAERFVGTKEIAGAASNPLILAMLRLDDAWPDGDEVPWCAAFVNFICWQLRLPRSKSLAARSWLNVGRPVTVNQAIPGFDVVVLERGAGGHVGFFTGFHYDPPLDRLSHVYLLGGNQANTVTIAPFSIDRVLGIRRVLPLGWPDEPIGKQA
jgi:uncharacterized protein (TIGR02594 family)